jgi:hypothetical protein
MVLLSACGALKIATLEQDMLTSPDSPYSFGSNLMIGSSYMHVFTVSETTTTTTNISGVTAGSGCTHFLINAGPGSACGGIDSGDHGPSGSGMPVCPFDYTFKVSFQPAIQGMETCQITVNGVNTLTGTDDYPMTLSGSAMGNTFAMNVSPSSIPFGDQPLMIASSPATITVTNTGSGTLDITTTLSQSGSDFQEVGGSFGSSHSLGSGSSEDYGVECQPFVIGPASGTVMVTAPEGSLMGSSSLSCNGVVSNFVVAPTPAGFGTTLVGVNPGNLTLTLSSSTPAMLTDAPRLDATAVAAGVSVPMTSNTAAFGSGSDATVTLAWNAAAPATGDLGTVTLDTQTDHRVVPITGIAQPAGIGTNPATLELGPICIGGSASTTLDVYASDVGDVTLASASAGGSMFAVDTTGLTFPYTLGGNHAGDATMTVSASPALTAAAGDANGMVVLTTNLPPAPSQTDIAIHATVLSGGLGASPNGLAFGTVQVLKTSSPKSTTIANCSGAPLTITNTSITGPNAADFVLVSPDSNHLTGTIPNAMSQEYSIVMLPQTKGQKMAELEIDYGQGSAFTVPLTGNSGSAAASGARETYYACSAGGGSGAALWPIGFAGAWLARRRRRR